MSTNNIDFEKPDAPMEILTRRASGFTVEDLIQFLQMTCRTSPSITKMKLSLSLSDDLRIHVTQIRVDQAGALVHFDTI
jgi:hypothetical protein